MAKKEDTIKIGELCYLAHPATTYGSLEENTENSVLIKERLEEKYKVSVINPLKVINPKAGVSWEIVMEQCKKLLRTSDALILGPKWYLSRGCRQEAIWAMEWQMDIYIYSQETDSVIRVDSEELLQTLNTKEIYNDININIKHDANLVYINYFGNQYTFSKHKKQIIVPDKDNEALAIDFVIPENYLENVGRGVSLYAQLPEEYHDLLSKDMDYSFFLGNQDQLCLKSNRLNEHLYMNKYNAYILLLILRSWGNQYSGALTRYNFCFESAEINNTTTFRYCIDNEGSAHNYIHRLNDIKCVKVYYDTKKKEVKISKDGKHFGFTNLETHYLMKLLGENLPNEIKIKY